MPCVITFGQGCEAALAVRKAHSEKLLDRPKNKFTYFSAGHQLFQSPKACLTAFV